MASLSLAPAALFSSIVLVTAAFSQTNSQPAFDVASVKGNKSGTGVDRIRNKGGILFIENVPLRRLIAMAFDVPESQNYLLSGPDWLESENFDIQARFPPDTPDPTFLKMFRKLLEDRFKMVSHREPKEFSVLALVSAKGKKGRPNLHPAAAPSGPYRFRALGGHATGFSISMPMLAGRLSRPDFGLDRPVLDFTGLDGTFDLTLDWKPDHVQEDQPAPEGASDASIFAALTEQLGLRLEPRKVSLDVLVIDRISKVPAEN